MPSQIAWLDASSEEQRRMREIIQLFSERASLDDLGLGQIRDAVGDGLFPGTSTLLTRARYTLFIPWCFQQAASHRDPATQADKLERDLIEAMRATGTSAGLIGAQAGRAVKNLPSVLYWSFLRHYEILADPTLDRHHAAIRSAAAPRQHTDDGPSLTSSAWTPSLPAPPTGFPREVPGGFAMTRNESEWLQERILQSAPGSVLSHLAVTRPSEDSTYPWDDPALARVSGGARGLLDHARNFSVVMHGAQLLYNLLLAERYEQLGFDRIEGTVDVYRDALEEWQTTSLATLDLATWNVDELLNHCNVIRGSPVSALARRFVTDWLRLVLDAQGSALAESLAARTLVANRERQHKGLKSARLENVRRLQVWGGASGASALSFRWPQARRILVDIHNGLESTTHEEPPDA